MDLRLYKRVLIATQNSYLASINLTKYAAQIQTRIIKIIW